MATYVSLLCASFNPVSTTINLKQRPFRSGALAPSCLKLRSSALTVCRRASPPPACEDNCSDINKLRKHDLNHVQTITTSPGKWLPLFCMILVELINSGTILLGKVAVDQGIFVFALLCYRSSLGAVFTFPFALLFERNKWKPLDWAGFKWILLNSFVGYTLPMAMYYYGLRDTTASYAAIFSSLTPLVTFIISVMLSMEKVVIGTRSGKAKIAGALLCFGGALVCTLNVGGYPKMGRHQLRGTMLLLGDCICSALWYPIQWKLHELYPWKLWSTYFTCILGGLQTLIVGLAMKREPLAWKIGWNLQLLTIVYSAALGMATKYCLNLYVVSMRGPAYTSMFSSLSVIFTMLGALLLGEKVTFGGLSSASMVITGISLYLSGKAKDGSSSKCSPEKCKKKTMGADLPIPAATGLPLTMKQPKTAEALSSAVEAPRLSGAAAAAASNPR